MSNIAPVVVSNGNFHIENTSQRFERNPFIDYMEIRTNSKIIIGKTNAIATNTNTGEMMGQQMIASFRKVDAEQFVKIFADKISTIFDLSRAGYRMLITVIAVIQQQSIDKDIFVMSYNDAQKIPFSKDKPLTRNAFKRGTAELINNGIIARAQNVNMYYINPSVIYNGNRTKLTFVEQYEVMPLEEFAQHDLLSNVE